MPPLNSEVKPLLLEYVPHLAFSAKAPGQHGVKNKIRQRNTHEGLRKQCFVLENSLKRKINY